MDQPIVRPSWPMFFDLVSDPGELYNLLETKLDMGWIVGVALKFVADYLQSIAQYPNIRPDHPQSGEVGPSASRSCVREVTPSFGNSRYRCEPTVRGER